jgi:hypothetical protein
MFSPLRGKTLKIILDINKPGVKGEIAVGYLDPLTTQDLKSSGFPVG